MSHEINISEIVAGNNFISKDDGLKLYNELKRLLIDSDEVNIDFLGISNLGKDALLSSIGKIYLEYNSDRIKYINVSEAEQSLINSILLELNIKAN